MERKFRQTKIYATRSKNNEKIITGYALLWEDWSDLIWWDSRDGVFYERFLKGAFTESLKTKNQMALVEHDTKFNLGSVKDGNFEIKEDENGLYFRIELQDDAFSNEIYKQVKNGELTGASVNFRAIKDNWTYDDDNDIYYRTISRADLVEISLVEYPAYPSSYAETEQMRQKRMQLIQRIEEMLYQSKRNELLYKINRALKIS